MSRSTTSGLSPSGARLSLQTHGCGCIAVVLSCLPLGGLGSKTGACHHVSVTCVSNQFSWETDLNLACCCVEAFFPQQPGLVLPSRALPLSLPGEGLPVLHCHLQKALPHSLGAAPLPCVPTSLGHHFTEPVAVTCLTPPTAQETPSEPPLPLTPGGAHTAISQKQTGAPLP